MKNYFPWKEPIRDLSVLDIELGGACNQNCVYCDTPKYDEPNLLPLDRIKELLTMGNIRWVYICGLGEPTANDNVKTLKEILKICDTTGVKLSMFTNLVNMDEELFNYIDKGVLYVLAKMDTFDPEKIKKLYGVDNANTILKNYNKLLQVIHTENDKTNIAASIVPTSINKEELPKIVDYCIDNNIYPLLGQLEKSGLCSEEVYRQLDISHEDLIKVKDYIKSTYGVDYEIPTCPATIHAIHITNHGKVIVDKKTGLSCPWFWLKEPEIHEIGDISTMNLLEIETSIKTYRQTHFVDCLEYINKTEKNPFGGCGGDIKSLLQKYKKYTLKKCAINRTSGNRYEIKPRQKDSTKCESMSFS